MKVKRFIARDEQEAMIKVKNELGSDAIILHTRKIKKQGIRAWFSKPLVEVVAAIEERAPRKKEKQVPIASMLETSKPIPQERDIQEDNLREKIDLLGKMSDSRNTSDFSKKDDSENLNSEINSIKSMLSSVLNKIENGAGDTNTIRQSFKDALDEVHINTALIDEILSKVEEQIEFTEENSDSIKELILGIIKDFLGDPRELEISQSTKPQIVFFTGPTGVGKTTTIAKLAAKESLINNKSVALITADTYRIAAVDQLKTYSEILNIPISVIYEPKEINGEIEKYQEMDYIFVDTAGRNHKNKELIKEIGDLIEFTSASKIYLLLSLTTSYRDIENIINAYSFIDDYSIIFTKSDEASALGNILNIKYLTNKPLSYITTGQSVPDDIEVINTEKIANQLVGG